MNLFKVKNVLLFSLIFTVVVSSSYIFISAVHELQFTNSEYFKDQALSYRIKYNKLKASRGNIYDTNLNVVASSSRSFNIGIFPKQVRNVDEVATAIGVILNIDNEKITKKITSSNNFFYLKRNIEFNAGEEIKSWNLDGIILEPSYMRHIHSDSLKKIIGKVDPDENGIEGIEYYFNSNLEGKDGEIRYEASPNGKMIPQAEVKTVQPVHGQDIILTIDSDLQYLSESLCKEALIKTEALNCSIVFSYANSGEILISAEQQSTSLDSYNIDLISLRAIYEPGSSLKIFTIGAAIESELIDESTKFVVNDYIEIIEGSCAKNYQGYKACYRDFLNHDPYELSVMEIIERSSNVGTILATQDLEIDYLENYLSKFGFGKPTGVELTGELSGGFRNYKTCATCLSSLSIGYSINVTQLQMVKAYSIIANGGIDVNLSMVKKEKTILNKVQIISPETAYKLKKLLINVVDGENGTGRSLKLENYIIGGKTGTSRTHIEGVGYSDFRYNTSFTGFIETSKGPVVGSVILWGASVNPRSEYVTGGSTAAPIFKNIVSNLVPGE
ncbi:MAG: peptidoglycan D,D-transpeptidase FtsI family protein [Candidatus Actinomarina sp.]|tara:strand:+ start:1656 stop:3329 length:1674 start_codon:yes stop_codon:yes gene_type:complete